MRLRDNDRPARPIPLAATKPRNPVIQAAIKGFGTLNGHRHQDKRRAQTVIDRERFERLDFDQQIREVGEW